VHNSEEYDNQQNQGKTRLLLQNALYEGFWINQDTQFKNHIKQAILATLASSSSLVRRQVAQIISAIASIEIPRQEWGELIPVLCENSQNSDLNIRMTSLTTLGYICDELSTNDFSEAFKNLIIRALISNITDDPTMLEPTKLAIKALPNSIPYAK
jgi:importin subunit beta-1